CSVCHTPRGILGQEIRGEAFTGSSIEDWYAVNITSDPLSGIGKWSLEELVGFLAKGKNRRAVALGPMREVVTNSLAYLSEQDLRAMATYLKSIPAGEVSLGYFQSIPRN